MNKLIKLINIDKKEKQYLAQYHGILLNNLSLDQANGLFLKIGKEFKLGKLTLDELSVFGFKIFHSVAKKFPDSDLFFACLSVSELNFAVRNKAVYGNISMYLNDLDEFMKKYKTK